MEENKRKLASIQKITKIEPIPNADKIEKITILGWECVARKGEFEVGNLCVYFEIDSILPDKLVFEFMRNRKFRVKTIKLRGQISQGLALPLVETMTDFSTIEEIAFFKEGDDVTEVIGVRKYIHPLEKSEEEFGPKRSKSFFARCMLRFRWTRWLYLKALGCPVTYPFPSFVSKTNEKRIQNRPRFFDEVNKGLLFYITEKLDGCSVTYAWYKGKFFVCTRRNHLAYEGNNRWWKIANRLRIRIKLDLATAIYGDTAIQGEIVGPGIQDNKYQLDNLDFYIFNIYDLSGKTPRALTLEEKLIFCALYGLKLVPILETNKKFESPEIKDLVDQSKGSSELFNTMREGVVIRSMDNDKISIKIINPNFLLKYDE